MVEIKINVVSDCVIKTDMCLDGGGGGGGGASSPYVHHRLSQRMDIDFTLDILLGSKPT